jgi:hypothetical protein
MSTYAFKPGDRVRLTPRNHMQGYQPGEKGVVLRELLREVLAGISGTRYYWWRWTRTIRVKRVCRSSGQEIPGWQAHCLLARA